MFVLILGFGLVMPYYFWFINVFNKDKNIFHSVFLVIFSRRIGLNTLAQIAECQKSDLSYVSVKFTLTILIVRQEEQKVF